MKWHFFVGMFSLVLVVNILNANTVYVSDACGNDDWTGEDPCCMAPYGPVQTLDRAVEIAHPGYTIIVADGIYTGEFNNDLILSVPLTIKSENGPDNCIFDCLGNRFITINHGSSSAQSLIEGLTIKNGYHDMGGAIHCDRSRLNLINCRFLNNIANSRGGAVYAVDAELDVNLCEFTNNSAGTGGALFSEFSIMILDGSEFTSNSTSQGGGGAVAVLAQGSDRNTTVNNCTFLSNVSYGPGGAIMCNQSTLNVTNSEFKKNTFTLEHGPPYPGAALWLINCYTAVSKSVFNNNICRLELGSRELFSIIGSSNASLLMEDCDYVNNLGSINGEDVTMIDCRISNNSVHNLFIMNENTPSVTLNGCHITRNTVEESIGWFGDGNFSLSNCLIAGNVSTDSAPVLRFENGSLLDLSNTTLADNWSMDRENLPVIDAEGAYGIINNSILWNPWYAREIDAGNYSAISVNYCDVLGGIPGHTNFQADPCFAAPGSWDENGTPGDYSDDTWILGDYHLKSRAGRWHPVLQSWVSDQVTSPCVDRGDPYDNVHDEPMPHGGRINIGAYGGTAYASKSIFCYAPVPGDTTGDCKVNLEDFYLMTAYWLECNLIPPSACN